MTGVGVAKQVKSELRYTVDELLTTIMSDRTPGSRTADPRANLKLS